MKNIIYRTSSVTSKIFLSTLIFSLAALPVYAYDGQYSTFDNQSGLKSSITAGFRLSIPFGPTKKSKDKVRYGFQLNLRRDLNNSVGWNGYGYMSGPQTFNAELVSLDFSENGFKGLSFAGRQTLIYKNGVLMAVEDKDEKDGGHGWLIAALLVGGAVAASQAGKGVGRAIGEAICSAFSGNNPDCKS